MKTIEIHDGVQFVDVGRISLRGRPPVACGVRHQDLGKKYPTKTRGRSSAQRGQDDVRKEESSSGINQRGMASRSVKGFISGFFTARFLSRRGAGVGGLAVSGSRPRRAGPLAERLRSAWRRLWRGAFIVSWDDGAGRCRVFWQWGEGDGKALGFRPEA